MADLHKFTVQESLNASQGHSGRWDTSQGYQTVDSGSSRVPLSAATHIVILQSTVDVYIRFSNTDDNINSNRDIKILADTIFSINVPRGIEGTVKLIFSRAGGSDGTLKIVEV